MSDEKNAALEEHRAKIAEMKAAEARVRTWLDGHVEEIDLKWPDGTPVRFVRGESPQKADVRLLLERIDAYEASITWHTDCLNCPHLYDRCYALEEQIRLCSGSCRIPEPR